MPAPDARPAPPPEVSIVIVNWNTRDELRRCLAAIARTSGARRVETIVVDNASADGSEAMVRGAFPEAQVIQSGANLGFGRACNLGLARSRAPFVLFLNPDAELQPETLERLLAAAERDPALGLLGCKVRHADGTVRPLGLQWFPTPGNELLSALFLSDRTYGRLPRFFPRADANRSAPVRKLYGSCLMARRAMLDRIGGFDERFFMYSEDVDLCRRAADAGWKVYYLSEAEVVHAGAAASARSAPLFASLMQWTSRARLIRKYQGRAGELRYRAALFAGALARLLVLLPMLAASPLRGRSAAAARARSFRKYAGMLKFSAGLARPSVPSAPEAT